MANSVDPDQSLLDLSVWKVGIITVSVDEFREFYHGDHFLRW